MQRKVYCGSIPIGGGSPVSIQSMITSPLTNEAQAIAEIEELANAGCHIARAAVPSMECAKSLKTVAAQSPIPLVADIHFDYRLAIASIESGAAKVRINPGNIGSYEKAKIVATALSERGLPLRIGINSGSIEKDLLARHGGPTPQAMVESAESHIAILEKASFYDTVVSLKSSDIKSTIAANRLFRSRHEYPLHLGITEAGIGQDALTKSAIGIGSLLADGIGDTIRVSLSDTMENEVIAAREIVRAASQIAFGDKKLSAGGVKIISCPRCGRHGFDTHEFTSRWMPKLYCLEKDITVAVMGCEVNGPEEAKHADIGITGAGDKVLIFKHGKIVKTVSSVEADTVFAEELKNI
ncbi:MAG: flavodoxin-dependent (E)-4-hydroxy-3-methylbut-2-enyl-diphosphate synthase [Eubacteriaceae bacterium]|nr:flavodoxin-dependent (E)-4-hydroxy-3-methylbut-2-enyl-diphosphate synthase [Eubacteriaceae bacterium]